MKQKNKNSFIIWISVTYEFFVSCHGVATEFHNDMSNTVAFIHLPGIMVRGYTVHLITWLASKYPHRVNFWAVQYIYNIYIYRLDILANLTVVILSAEDCCVSGMKL